MQQYNLDITVETPFGNLFRKEHVLIVVLDDNNQVLVGLKPEFLPPGVSRLLGGGVKKDELPIQGAIRELREELGVLAKENDLREMFKVKSHAVDRNRAEYNTTTYIYLYRLKTAKFEASSDVAEVVRLTLTELKNLADTYNNFDDTLWYERIEGKHKWADYGKLYGPIHGWVYEHLTEGERSLAQ